ncbi:hypothetical protein VTK73DRAFT_2706 [Phialemonium thermophilum]|uniref:Uncharacterized protein n=1 Tax=Phialemonium thermophilum TaxID=223376 RepID=A0ABR3VQS7_9PEZI
MVWCCVGCMLQKFQDRTFDNVTWVRGQVRYLASLHSSQVTSQVTGCEPHSLPNFRYFRPSQALPLFNPPTPEPSKVSYE